jgi:uncharacterized protein (DUF58 family)
MTAWSKPSHKLATSSYEELPDDFNFGIELSLGQLIEMRNKPIIQWLDPDSKVKTNRIGGFRSRYKGRGMDFDESRIYQIGDDIRNIDWRVTARTGEAHTKLFKEERERPVFVLLDQMPGMFFGTAEVFKSVLASKIAAQLMWNTLANGDRFGAMLFSEQNHVEMKPSSNRRNCMRLLHKIVESHQSVLSNTFGQNQEATQSTDSDEATLEKNAQFSAALKRLKHIAKPGSLIHIISDFNQFDEKCQRHLSNLTQHTDVHCLMVSDPIEKELPPAGLYGITDGLNDGLLNTQQTSLRQRYKDNFETKIQNIKSFALSHKGVFTHIDTNFNQSTIGQPGSNIQAGAL